MNARSELLTELADLDAQRAAVTAHLSILFAQLSDIETRSAELARRRATYAPSTRDLALDRASQLAGSEDERAAQRVARWMVKRLARGSGSELWGDLRRAMPSRDRWLMGDAVDVLIAAELVTVENSARSRRIILTEEDQ